MEEQILAVDLSTEQTLEVNLPEQDNVAQIDVYWQDEVVLDLDASLMYIVSGQQEIQDYVDNKSKPEIDSYVQEYARPIVADVVDQIATPVIDEYFEGTVKPSITEFAEKEMAGYAQTATEQAVRTEALANTVSQTVEEFNTQTEATKNEFVAFVEDKTVQLEEVASNAATEATESAEKARIWADGEQAEVEPLGGTLSSMGAADLAYAIANAPEDTPIDASGLFAMNVVKGPKGDKGDKGEDGKDGGGLEIGDIAFAALGIDESKNLRRYLNGQVISQNQFQSFAKLVKERIALYPSLAATEENWQAEVTNSKLGQCGKFVVDDALGIIRLPKVVNVQGLADLALMGNVKVESLPNITGEMGGTVCIGNREKGALYKLSESATGVYGNSTATSEYRSVYGFNASLSSSTYQDNAPVQQEAIQYPYFIQVATGVEESVDITREIELNNPFSLLDYKWSEYEIKNASWLLSNGAFHSGTVYKSVYELLLKLQNGTETKDGVSVKLSTEAYEDTDFVINTADTTFRLPIKVKLASGNAVVGNGMTLGVTNGTNEYTIYVGTNGTVTSTSGVGSLLPVENKENAYNTGILGVTTDPTKSGLVLADNDMYLYFYVGETIQDANVINASGVLTRVAELSNEYIVGLGMPDYSAGVSITSYTSSSNQFVAPCDGVLIFTLNISSSGVGIYIDDVLIALPSVVSSAKLGNAYSFTISKGQKFYVSSASFYTAYGINAFLPLKGVN